jgi:hypothetical protein
MFCAESVRPVTLATGKVVLHIWSTLLFFSHWNQNQNPSTRPPRNVLNLVLCDDVGSSNGRQRLQVMYISGVDEQQVGWITELPKAGGWVSKSSPTSVEKHTAAEGESLPGESAHIRRRWPSGR